MHCEVEKGVRNSWSRWVAVVSHCVMLLAEEFQISNEKRKRKKKEHTIGQNDTSVCVIWAMDTVEVRDGEHECESASCCITEMGGVGQ